MDETPNNRTLADRFVFGWNLVCFGSFLGVAVCSYWVERWHPGDAMRLSVYRIFYIAFTLVTAIPTAVLGISRGIRNHRRLLKEMESRTMFTPERPSECTTMTDATEQKLP